MRSRAEAAGDLQGGGEAEDFHVAEAAEVRAVGFPILSPQVEEERPEVRS